MLTNLMLPSPAAGSVPVSTKLLLAVATGAKVAVKVSLTVLPTWKVKVAFWVEVTDSLAVKVMVTASPALPWVLGLVASLATMLLNEGRLVTDAVAAEVTVSGVPCPSV